MSPAGQRLRLRPAGSTLLAGFPQVGAGAVLLAEFPQVGAGVVLLAEFPLVGAGVGSLRWVPECGAPVALVAGTISVYNDTRVSSITCDDFLRERCL